jgi:nicotinamide riboside kinase
MTKTIKFQEDGISFSDYKIQEVVNSFFADKVDTVLVTSTHLIIEEVWAQVLEGKIDYDSLHIFIDGQEWNFDRDMRSHDWFESQ